uniref:Activator of basal transcription 1 n=1 Tax=Drosophila melanogaster TaxID=7227 RepID=Q8IRM9_DROME|nr:uncharacterized protein Dmel_CG32706 [Drosophila melanogaster]AAN09240.1 uncharacterized protein Dmel_CG32706 [Drosophila melanogaster]|eukprot:NP_727307.1 uncharacterized protein Dmel_CG32706 [Drosophila melanogaster]
MKVEETKLGEVRSGKPQTKEGESANGVANPSNDDKKELANFKATFNSWAPEKKREKMHKVGVILISNIPKDMDGDCLKEIMNLHSVVGRVYVQPETLSSFKTKKNMRKGWVEFISKSGAKKIALELNNKPITDGKSSRFRGLLWKMKFLPRFKWYYLTDRMDYELAVCKVRVWSQARKRATFLYDPDQMEYFKKQVKKMKKVKKAEMATRNAEMAAKKAEMAAKKLKKSA